VTNHFRTIPVLDANGDQLTLYEIRERGSPFGLIPKKRLQLCTGETVKRKGASYVIEATGEKLTRVRPGR
jgi:hypothetical protein